MDQIHLALQDSRIFLLTERSDGGGPISRLFESVSVCPYYSNIVTVIFRKSVISIGILENLESYCNFWPEPN